jgi:anti-sigma-K factor RskA
MNNPSLIDLLPAYALGALSEEERVQVEAFLASSEEARAELRTYEAMLAGLATIVPARKAPPHLTDDFRRRLAAAAVPASVPPTPVQPSILTRRQWNRPRPLLLGLAALIVVAIGVFLIYRVTQNVSEAQAIQNILGNPAAVRTTLNPQPGATGNVAFVTLPESNLGVLVAELPQLPEEKQYQLWLLKPQDRDSGAVFSATGSVRQLLVNMPGPPSEYQAIGITVEPKGGSTGPTTDPIFVGQFVQ